METTIMENQMEKKMENEMETGIFQSRNSDSGSQEQTGVRFKEAFDGSLYMSYKEVTLACFHSQGHSYLCLWHPQLPSRAVLGPLFSVAQLCLGSIWLLSSLRGTLTLHLYRMECHEALFL